MTTNDFFLIERAAQIQRLRNATSGNRVNIPGRVTRMSSSAKAKRLFHAMDQIGRIPLTEKRKKWLQWLKTHGGNLIGFRRTEASSDTQNEEEPELLTPERRSLLNQFERQIVELKLTEGDEASDVAHEIIKAIQCDHDNFNGLKPLQFHSDSFAHECLFPSWLNLYTALVLPRSDSIEPRFSQSQIRTIFDFLHEFESGGESPNGELVGALTLVANRQIPATALPVIQHIVNLGSLQADRASVVAAATIERLREQSGSVDSFLGALKSLAIFETCAIGDQIDSDHQLGVELPRYEALPPSIISRLQTLATQEDQFAVWTELVRKIASIAEKGGIIDDEFAEFLEQQTDHFGDWLALLVPTEDGQPLSGVSQRLLTRIIRRAEAFQSDRCENTIRSFAGVLAPRLDVLDGPSASLFEKEFIAQDRNRELLLRSVDDHARRREISRQLVTHAKKIHDCTQLLSQLTIAAILDPDYDAPKLAGIGRTIKVLDILQEQGFISSSQFDDLASDVRRRLPDSMQFLVAPYLGASDQEGRLAKLYMALYEECEKFEHTGEIGNFGLTTAAYGNLNRTIDRDV